MCHAVKWWAANVPDDRNTSRHSICHHIWSVAFAVSQAARAMDQPNEAECIDVKRIFKYLRGTSNYGVLYATGISKKMLEAFIVRHSTSSVETVCKQCNCMVKPTAMVGGISTTEAEFIAASAGAKKLLWLKRLLGEVG